MKQHELPKGPKPKIDDGVDVTLIRWMLSLEPAARLAVAQSAANSLLQLRGNVRTD